MAQSSPPAISSAPGLGVKLCNLEEHEAVLGQEQAAAAVGTKIIGLLSRMEHFTPMQRAEFAVAIGASG